MVYIQAIVFIEKNSISTDRTEHATAPTFLCETRQSVACGAGSHAALNPRGMLSGRVAPGKAASRMLVWLLHRMRA
jgi:hypothetical protein